MVGGWSCPFSLSTNHQPPTVHVHRAFRPGLCGEAVGAAPVARGALCCGDLRRSVVARSRRARHRARSHRAGHHRFHASRVHQLSVLAFAADADAHGRALRLADGAFLRAYRTQPPAIAPIAPIAPTLVIVLLLVVSHWVLDVVTHIPDMPLYPNGPKFGLGLWNSVPGTLAVETVMFALGVWIYARATKARDAIGKWAFVGVTAFLFVGFVVNANGTPPPSVTALWMMALGLGALTLWLAWFADRHRNLVRSVRLQPDELLQPDRIGGHMATQATPVAAPRAAIWEDFIDIFYAPSSVFRRRENGNFFIPLAVITIVCGGALLSQQRRAAADVRRRVRSRDGDRRCARIRTSLQRRSSACAASRSRMQQVVIFIFIPLAIFGVGVTTWLDGKLVDAKQTFRAALVVGAYAYAPRIIDGVLQGLQGLFLDPSAARRPLPAVARHRAVPRSRHRLAAAPRDRGPRRSHHDLDHRAHRDRPLPSPAASRSAKPQSRRQLCGSWAGCR